MTSSRSLWSGLFGGRRRYREGASVDSPAAAAAGAVGVGPNAAPDVAGPPMDVKALVNPEERLLLLERASVAWGSRVAERPEALARRRAALDRARPRVPVGPTLLVGADRTWLTDLASDGAEIVVVELATSARESLGASHGGDGTGHVVVQSLSWWLRALDDAAFGRVVIPAFSIAATSPPIAAELVRMAARVLKRDGILYVEACVHRPGHAWRARTELGSTDAPPTNHVLPAGDLFSALAAERTVPLDVRELLAPAGEIALAVLARRGR